MNAPYSKFDKTKLIPVIVYLNGQKAESNEWDETLWIERSEDWYALSNPELYNKKVRIVEQEVWLKYPSI